MSHLSWRSEAASLRCPSEVRRLPHPARRLYRRVAIACLRAVRLYLGLQHTPPEPALVQRWVGRLIAAIPRATEPVDRHAARLVRARTRARLPAFCCLL